MNHHKKGKMSKPKKSKPEDKRVHAAVKSKMHPRNLHNARYDFGLLKEVYPELSTFVSENIYGDETIPFANPDAVKALNKALLMAYYDVLYWDIPQGYLCPPIPGRADYIHHAADILSQSNYGKIPFGSGIKCLDIGVGANGIYPIIGCKSYGWTFVGSDIDTVSLASCQHIIDNNSVLKDKIELRHQTDQHCVFKNIIKEVEFFDLVICNPPFHASAEEAKAGNERKTKNLGIEDGPLNFGGHSHELWCEGGEERFIRTMIHESKLYSKSCLWFTTLVSKQSNLKKFESTLNNIGVAQIRNVPMGQGNKSSRLLAWTYQDAAAQREWAGQRWKIPVV